MTLPRCQRLVAYWRKLFVGVSFLSLLLRMASSKDALERLFGLTEEQTKAIESNLLLFGVSLAGVYFVLSLVAIALWAISCIRDRRRLPRDTYNFRPARASELAEVDAFSDEELGSADMAGDTATWFEKDPKLFWVQHEVSTSSADLTRETMAGTFAVIPFNERACKCLEQNAPVGRLEPEDVVAAGTPAAAVYVGAVIARDRMARAAIVAFLQAYILQLQSHDGGIPVYARPINEKSRLLLKANGFKAVAGGGVGVIHVRKQGPLKGGARGTRVSAFVRSQGAAL